ncbi:OLC1v1030794C1 [Oldenlandia corymbosa var. corymbosa]|uniref:OLC1v1030794C1 n=1 Tax=Oldenlandia corymbosa var. corymbosa TaxID=529605 RepID=A0AAV1CI01_OLDCO|nr:OLC1v1030794C1 [Oldenlandia corymbosa var. corymbosa]
MDDKAKDLKDSGDSANNSLILEIGRDLSMECLACCARVDYGKILMVNRSFKSVILRGDELYKLRRKLGIIEYWVYFSCNHAEWEAFDTIGHQYQGLPPIPASECFNVVTDSWVDGVTPNSLRYLFASGSLGEIAIVAGGCDSEGKILGSAEMYDSNKGMWRALPSLNTPRKSCSGVVMDERFYAIGGIGLGEKSVDGEVGNPKVLTSGEVFDMKTNLWVEIPNILPGHIVEGVDEYAHASTKSPPLLAVVRNELYAAYHEEMLLKKYNMSMNVWTTIGRLPENASLTNG